MDCTARWSEYTVDSRMIGVEYKYKAWIFVSIRPTGKVQV
jgi:hypothetical protein